MLMGLPVAALRPPRNTTSAPMPSCVSSVRNSKRLVSLSSATSTRSPVRFGVSVSAVGGLGISSGNGICTIISAPPCGRLPRPRRRLLRLLFKEKCFLLSGSPDYLPDTGYDRMTPFAADRDRRAVPHLSCAEQVLTRTAQQM